jgi:hypothetical protein
MVTCANCGATVLFGAKRQAGYTFCSRKCLNAAAVTGVPVTPPVPHGEGSIVPPLLSVLHALVPLALLLVAQGAIVVSSLAYLAMAFFWSWPLWLVPLSRNRDGKPGTFAVPVVLSCLALLVSALPMLLLTLVALGAKISIQGGHL